jgi:hypothetical protein
MMTDEEASECGRPLRIRKGKRPVRSEGMGADEMGGRDEREVRVWGGGKQNKQKRLANKVPKPGQLSERRQEKIEKNKQP